MLTVSLLLVSDFLGLMPDTRKNEVELRQYIAESLAVQVSMEIGVRDSTKLSEIVSSSVERNDRVLGVAVRLTNGIVRHSAGEHSLGWTLAPLAESTLEQVRVALYSPKGRWGDLEIVFDSMPFSESIFRGGSSVLKVVLLVMFSGFIGYFFFLKKVIRELDPEQMLPDRVRGALDSLTDGLMIISHDGVIMFCNQALASRIGINARRLTGREISRLDWVAVGANANERLPWVSILDRSEAANEQPVDLRVGHHQLYKFVVRASPIMGVKEDLRGVMITFSDVTELEKKNSELSLTLANLEESQAEIEAKNRELFTMATRDPLTDLFNRRALFDAFDTLFEQTLQGNSRLGCIMLDIDHFKSVNDTHGHGVGDEVIVYLADTLRAFQGDIDVVGRFGGEEFCMLMPDATVEATCLRAEKIRIHIEQGVNANISVPVSITTSFGVSYMPGDARTPSELVEFADLALYEAKTTGRNRVVSWHGDTGGKQETKHLNNGFSRSEERRRKLGSSMPEKSALIESGRGLTHRQILSSNIETVIVRAKQESSLMAVVVFDGSGLQHISHNVNFNVGNQLCSALVDRIKKLLREEDVVSQTNVDEGSGAVTQTGHNEIVVLLSNIDVKESIAGIVERLLRVFDQRIVIGGVEYVVESNAGISVLGSDGETADVLFQNACIACSDAKMDKIRNSYSFYSPQMDEAAKRYIRLQTDLHQAMEKKELAVFYQPKMDLMSGELVGFEALLRWHHAQLGMVSPDEFIPIAETSGLTHQLYPWVMTEVIDQLKLWRQSGHRVDSVAVNISAIELRDPEFSNKVLNILNSADMQPSSMEIEITESLGIDELDVARENLERLSHAGMPISIDDFGTGYSSLGYLQHFPISRLKIDRIFVIGCTNDEKKARVVRSIITMGNSLGMRVLAEGVENQEQLLFLRDHHCDEIQGHFVSKPVNAAQTTANLDQPGKLSQKVLGVTMGKKVSGGIMVNLPLSGLDAVLTRFPDAANDEQELSPTSDQATS